MKDDVTFDVAPPYIVFVEGYIYESLLFTNSNLESWFLKVGCRGGERHG
jgi:hypothetical protein